MRICYVTSAFPPAVCGVGDHIALVAQELAKQNEVFIITSKIEVASEWAERNICVLPIINVWNIFSWFKICKEIIKINPDIVHFEYPTLYPVKRSKVFQLVPLSLIPKIILALKRKLPKFVITIHEFYKSNILAKPKIICDAWLCDQIIIVSNADIARLSKFVSPNKINFSKVGSNVPVYFNKNYQKEIFKKEILGISAETLLIGYFGFIDPSKGFDILLKALASLSEKPVDYRLLVIGKNLSDSPYHQKMKSLINALNLSSKIIFSGYVKDEKASEYFFSPDVFVLPYQNGATWNRSSMIAPLIHHQNILTTYVKGITPEEFYQSKKLFLIEPNNSKKIAEKLIEINSRKKELSSIKENWPEIFSWEKTAQKTMEACDKALKKSA